MPTHGVVTLCISQGSPKRKNMVGYAEKESQSERERAREKGERERD